VRRFMIVQSDKEFFPSHSGLALVALSLNMFCTLPAKAMETFPTSAGSNGIGLDDILRSYVVPARNEPKRFRGGHQPQRGRLLQAIPRYRENPFGRDAAPTVGRIIVKHLIP
jgi:hypothetical protein